MSESKELKFTVSSVISISKDSFCEDIPERLIKVTIQIFNNSVFSNSTSQIKHYMYTSDQTNEWPKLELSYPLFCDNGFVDTKNHAKTRTLKVATPSHPSYVKLSNSNLHVLEKQKNDKSMFSSHKSPRTRKLKPPNFDLTSPNVNLLITNPNLPQTQLPHELSIRVSNKDLANTNYYTYQAQKNYNKRNNRSMSNTTKPSTTNRTKNNPDNNKGNIKQNKTEKLSKEFDFSFRPAVIPEMPKIPVIFREKKEKVSMKETFENRPFFTTSQEPLKKQLSYYYELRNTTSQIL